MIIVKIKNKIAIVTGARRGIGKAIALGLAREGATVVVSDLDLGGCKLVCEEIKKMGGESMAIKCDVSIKKDVSNLINQTLKKFNRVDILVNNAGIVVMKPLLETTEQDWDLTMNINLKGVFLCTQAVASHMIKQKMGKIISIASIAGEVGFANTAAYCASKAGIINLTREISLELAPHNININAIAPGVIATAMTADMLKDKNTKKSLLKDIPLGRVGKPEDIANAALFLASEEANFISGHTLVVDGGWLSK